MNSKLRAWVLILLVAGICGLSIWGVAWYRSRSFTPQTLLERLPAGDALIVYVDFDALRRDGILKLLNAPAVAEDPEYVDFVRKTEFDYKQDLNSAMVAFLPTGKFLLLKGRFDWKSLRAYVTGQSGTCYNSLCRMAGSTPDRRISFFPLQSGLMALAVSTDDSAALQMRDSHPKRTMEIPDAPVWLSVPPSVLRADNSLPTGTRMFARSLESAEMLTLSFVPEGTRIAAKLNVLCRNDQDASDLAGQLSATTSLLRDLISREHDKPNPADLSGVLTSGSFRSQGKRVFGYWPIERSFLENMLSGGAS
ncbi:MAG TPA: hypothetical protein VG675_25500 [Bryobacteraceae bacterium]|nr:hypothetical protein [Bryobacteraceae bacterium]